MANSRPLQSLRTRVISALIALAVISVISLTLRVNGLKFLCFFAVIAGSHELGKLLLDIDWRDHRMWVFVLATLAVFTGSTFWPQHVDIVIALAFLALGVYGLLIHRFFGRLVELQDFISKALLSLFYLGLFPSFICRLLTLPRGETLFFGFLGIVFAGDILAYFVGIRFGSHKLMEQVSPKKTVEGALGGLVGSVLLAEILGYVLNQNVNLHFALIGICVGCVAQAGDFFESLLKRVGRQKDSGAIMPGHGGVLDRLDGVLFSAPIFYLFMIFGN